MFTLLRHSGAVSRNNVPETKKKEKRERGRRWLLRVGFDWSAFVFVEIDLVFCIEASRNGVVSGCSTVC